MAPNRKHSPAAFEIEGVRSPGCGLETFARELAGGLSGAREGTAGGDGEEEFRGAYSWWLPAIRFLSRLAL